MLHYKLGHLKNYDKSKIAEYEAEVDKILNDMEVEYGNENEERDKAS